MLYIRNVFFAFLLPFFEEFGENRLDQLIEHKNKLQHVKFHYIGSLQSRKISEIMDNCISIHTLSRKKEAEIINKHYSNQKVFVQINIDNDPNKLWCPNQYCSRTVDISNQ